MIRSAHGNISANNHPRYAASPEPTSSSTAHTTQKTSQKTQVQKNKNKSKGVDGGKLMSMFNAARALGFSMAEVNQKLGVLQKSGLIDKKTIKLFMSVFLELDRTGTLSPAINKKLSSVSMGTVGKSITVLTGLFNTLTLISQKKYPQAAAEIYKTAAGVALSGQDAAISLINGTLQAFYPGYKDSPLCKFIGGLDLVSLGGVAVDSVGTLFTAWNKNGADIKKLDALVQRMRASGAGTFVDAGEQTGLNIYDINHQLQTSGSNGWKAYTPTFILKQLSK